MYMYLYIRCGLVEVLYMLWFSVHYIVCLSCEGEVGRRGGPGNKAGIT